MVIKLKKLLKEHAWDRKFGEPLPTLKDVVEKHTVKIDERGPEYGEVFGVEIARVVQNRERVAYRVFKSSGGKTISGVKEYSIKTLGDDKAFEKAKKEALTIIKGWK